MGTRLIGVDLVSVLSRGDSYYGDVKYWHGFLVIDPKADQILVENRADGSGIRTGVSSSSVSTMAALLFPLSYLGWTFSFISSSSHNGSAYLLTASTPSLCCSII